jgi:hypothetical protein
MGKNSTRVNFFKVIEGDKSEAGKLPKTLSHNDIKTFIARFAEAILVDQKRVNKLPRKDFHPLYNNGMWKRNREDHVYALVKLTITVDDMPKHLLEELTALSLDYKPAVVKQPLLDIISDLATGVASLWLYETSSLFFSELIQAVRRKDTILPPKGNPTELMLKWFDYDDPIQIAKDPECEYVGLLASHIEQESEKTKRTLALRSRLAFEKSIAARKYGDLVFP